MRTIAIVNQKGGCGKTTTAINLAGVLAREGFRTLLVDLDPQSHCAAGLGVPEARIDQDIGDAMLSVGSKAVDPLRLLWRAGRNLDLAPSRMKLAGLEASRGGLADKNDKERRLAMVLSELSPMYDVALVDCSPAIGLLTFNALTAADTVLIPVETAYFSLQGATKQVHTVTTLGKRLGAEPALWLLATIHDSDSSLASDLLNELRRRFAGRVAPTVIRRDVKLKEAASFGQPVVEYAPESTGAADYGQLGHWLKVELGLTRKTGAEGLLKARHSDEPEIVHVDEDDADGVTVLPSEPGTENELTRRVMHTDTLPAAQVAAPATDGGVGISRSEDLARVVQRLARRDAPAAAVEPVYPTLRMVEQVEPKSRGPVDGRLVGVRVTGQGVLFVQPLSIGRSVAIAGDFNGWSAVTHQLRRNEALGVFELCVKLPAGKRLYRLVVDGQWTADPFNNQTELNPFGEPNSVVNVPAA